MNANYGGASKYDIRDWASGHEKMGKGITLSKDEIKELYKIPGKILDWNISDTIS